MSVNTLWSDRATRELLAHTPHFFGMDVAISALGDLFATSSPNGKLLDRPAWEMPLMEFAAQLEVTPAAAAEQVWWLSSLTLNGTPMIDYDLPPSIHGRILSVRPSDGIEPKGWTEVVLRARPTLPYAWGVQLDEYSWVSTRYLPVPPLDEDDWATVKLDLLASELGMSETDTVRTLIGVAMTRTDGEPTLYLCRRDWNDVDLETGQEFGLHHEYQVLRRQADVLDELDSYAERDPFIDPSLLAAYEHYFTREIDKWADVEWR